MSDDTPTSSLSHREVEAAHHSLQQALSQHRLSGLAAVDTDAEVDNPDAHLQESIMRFYELLRPHIKRSPKLQKYWEGGLADYPADGMPTTVRGAKYYYAESSVGVWQIQVDHDTIIPQQPRTTKGRKVALADGGELPDTPTGWHQRLRLSEYERVYRVQRSPADDVIDGWYTTILQFSILGLRDLDTWEIDETVKLETDPYGSESFMVAEDGGDDNLTKVPDPEPARKLITAARMLIESAVELGALTDYDTADDREAEITYDHLI